MRIGILVLGVDNYKKNKFYNAQEIGLAKALDHLVDKVVVYILVRKGEKRVNKLIDNCANSYLCMIPALSLGKNGFVNNKKLDSNIDALICFSDTQLAFPGIYKWCKKNNIILIPYIGTDKSHSKNVLKRFVINLFFIRNLFAYRKLNCLMKTSSISIKMRKRGVKNIEIAPVGIDFSILKKDYMLYAVKILREKYGYKENEKIVLFVGRMEEEKQPRKMIEIFVNLYRKNNQYRLLMVGDGKLNKVIQKSIIHNGLGNVVKRIKKIPNKDIWELYRISEVFINLNRHEIYGMAIMEAMFYECKVIAWRAPGPDFILKNNVTGYLVDSEDKAVNAILNKDSLGEAAHNTICSEFTWDTTVDRIMKIVNK